MRARVRADRREAAVRTFLIADIRGYTRFTTEHGDETTSRLAAKFADISTEGVEAWGGTLLELRGDEALAVFDSARFALRAAVELQAAFTAETAVEPELPLGVGMGLDAGEALAVGEGYRGAALNLAARLCSMASAGQVIASQNLVHLVGALPDLAYTELGPTLLKGIDEPVSAVDVKGTAAVPAPVVPTAERSTPGPLPPTLEAIVPLAGRVGELRWLAWHWRRATHGAGRAVVMSGPPGIGKTRLASELAAHVHADGATVHYLPAAAGIGELDMSALDPGAGQLLIVDDLDAARAIETKLVGALARQIQHRPVMLLVTHRREAAPAVVRLVEGFSPPEQRQELSPLQLDDVRAIAALYAGRGVDRLPLADLLAESGGVPAAVHRLAAAWARDAASERLASSAQLTSAGRRGLVTVQNELIGSVTDFEFARERAELYGADGLVDHDTPKEAQLDVCPYKGLAAFEAADADYYFGRERLVAELVARLVGAPFLGLIGASGSGKSSALRAGLLPALAGGVLPGSDAWLRVLLRPTETPMAELGRALARSHPDGDLPGDDPQAALDSLLDGLADGQRLVIVVDQFEEVFNATREEAERQAFIDLLTTERSGLKVVVAIRADHYGHCAAYPALARLIGTNQVLVGALTKAELAAVIEHPAQRVGLRVEPELTAALLDDIGDEPGTLPLLSTALLELWQARDRGRLTLAAYHQTGGVRGAVERLAEAAYGSLDEDQRLIARSVFLRLAGSGEGEAVVRRQVSLAELDAERDRSMAEVLAALTDARLLTAGEGYVEVAHEALLREWPRLQEWLDEDAAGRAVRLHLIDAAGDWEQRGREPGDLYRGARLAGALDWAPTHEVELNVLEREFLEESRMASERDVQRQRATNRRLRVLLAGAAVFLVAAIGAGGFALILLGQAEDEARLATARGLAALAQANLDDDTELSILLAIEAAETTRRHDGIVLREAEQALHDSIGASRLLLTIRGVGADVALSPDGTRLLTTDIATNTASIRDTTTGSPVVTLAGHSGAVLSVEFSPDGGLIATASEDGTVGLWDAGSGAIVRKIRAHEGGVRSLRFGRDGSQLATLGVADEMARIWDVATGGEVSALDRVQPPKEVPIGAEGVAFLPGGLLAVGRGEDPNDERTVARILEPSTGREVLPLELDGGAQDIDVNTDGTLLAAGAHGGLLHVWRLLDGELLRAPTTNHHGDVMDIEFSFDGTLLATTSSDGTAKTWRVTDHGLDELMTIGGHNDAVYGVTLSRDNRRLVTSTATVVRVWDISSVLGGEALTLPGAESYMGDVLFTPDGNWIVATSGAEGVVRVFDAETGEVRLVLDPGDGDGAAQRAILGIDVSHDGTLIATASLSGTVRIYDAQTGEERVTFRDHGCAPSGMCGVSGVAFSPDGLRVASNGYDATVRIFDSETGRQIRVIEHETHPPGVLGHPVAWSPDGEQLLAMTFEGTHVWQASSGDHLFSIPSGGGPMQTAGWTPDGTLAVVEGGPGPMLHDARTGALVGTLTTGTPTLGLAFTRDGALVAIGGQTEVLTIWDWDLAAEVLRLPVPGPGRVDLSPDGKLVAHAHWNPVVTESTIRVFALDDELLLQIARDRVTRSLTDDECRQHLQRACAER